MIWVRLGSWLLCAGVALGAFGAHGLKARLSPEAMAVYHTAVLYHLVHGVGLLAVGWVATLKPNEALVRAAGWALVWGIALFSGSLYALSLTGIKKFGMITPLGGLLFLVGWAALALSAR